MAEEEKTIKVMGYFDKEVEKTKSEYVNLWIDNASLARLVICNGGPEFRKTYDWSDAIRDEIKKLAEFNWDYMYKEQEAEKLKEKV